VKGEEVLLFKKSAPWNISDILKTQARRRERRSSFLQNCVKYETYYSRRAARIYLKPCRTSDREREREREKVSVCRLNFLIESTDNGDAICRQAVSYKHGYVLGEALKRIHRF
jgi:hypothetical protein